MYLHIIKIKINIYIFYTSHGTAMNGQSIPLSHLTELKSECSKYGHLNELWLLCGQKTKSLRSHSTFFFLFFK